jgi:hypothetical protein
MQYNPQKSTIVQRNELTCRQSLRGGHTDRCLHRSANSTDHWSTRAWNLWISSQESQKIVVWRWNCRMHRDTSKVERRELEPLILLANKDSCDLFQLGIHRGPPNQPLVTGMICDLEKSVLSGYSVHRTSRWEIKMLMTSVASPHFSSSPLFPLKPCHWLGIYCMAPCRVESSSPTFSSLSMFAYQGPPVF